MNVMSLSDMVAEENFTKQVAYDPEYALWREGWESDRSEINEVEKKIAYFKSRLDNHVFNRPMFDALCCLINELEQSVSVLKERYTDRYGWSAYIFG